MVLGTQGARGEQSSAAGVLGGELGSEEAGHVGQPAAVLGEQRHVEALEDDGARWVDHLPAPAGQAVVGVDAALAPRAVAELLHLRPRSPLLLFQRTYFAASGEPVEYAITYQTGRRYPYRVGLSRSERRS